MACELSTGFTLDCKDGIGGIKKIVLCDTITSFGYSAGDVIDEITGAIAGDLYTYELPTQTGSFEETINFNRDNGTVFYTQTVNVMLHKLSAPKRLELQTVAKARPVVFVNDSNDNWWAIGVEFGADLSTSTAATGAALGDGNGYTLAFVHESPYRAYKCTGAPSTLIPA